VDSVDKVIWILPFLAVMDVASTLYMESEGFSLENYENGVFAQFFVAYGLTYVYAVIYPLGIVGLAYVLWHIKKSLSATKPFDKIVFLVLVGVACFICIQLTVAFVENLLLPYFISGEVSFVFATALLYLSMIFSLGLYIWHDVVMWVRTNGNEKKQ
jgi:hypothetical protein